MLRDGHQKAQLEIESYRQGRRFWKMQEKHSNKYVNNLF
jgi:hypothetical protein